MGLSEYLTNSVLPCLYLKCKANQCLCVPLLEVDYLPADNAQTRISQFRHPRISDLVEADETLPDVLDAQLIGHLDP